MTTGNAARPGGGSGVGGFFRKALRPFVIRVSPDGSKVTFISYSKLVYLWPFIPFGLIVWLLESLGVSSTGLGWATVIAVYLSWVVLCEDINFKGAVVVVLVIALFLALGVLSRIFLSVPYLSWIHHLFASLQVGFHSGLARGLAMLVAIGLIFYVVPRAFLVGRYEITSQEISHLRFMMGTVSHPRAGKKVRIEYPDLFELVVGLGGGQVTLYDPHGRKDLEIPNVLFLKLFEDEIERILESVGVREVAEAAAAAAATDGMG